MLVVKLYLHSGRYKIRCGCGAAIVQEAVKAYYNPETKVKCPACSKTAQLRKIPLLRGLSRPENWYKLLEYKSIRTLGSGSDNYGKKHDPVCRYDGPSFHSGG